MNLKIIVWFNTMKTFVEIKINLPLNLCMYNAIYRKSLAVPRFKKKLYYGVNWE